MDLYLAKLGMTIEVIYIFGIFLLLYYYSATIIAYDLTPRKQT